MDPTTFEIVNSKFGYYLTKRIERSTRGWREPHWITWHHHRLDEKMSMYFDFPPFLYKKWFIHETNNITKKHTESSIKPYKYKRSVKYPPELIYTLDLKSLCEYLNPFDSLPRNIWIKP